MARRHRRRSGEQGQPQPQRQTVATSERAGNVHEYSRATNHPPAPSTRRAPVIPTESMVTGSARDRANASDIVPTRLAARAQLRRKTQGDALGITYGTIPMIVPPPDPEGDWLYYNLDSNTLSTLTPARMLNMLADVSPECSRAIWDFLRLFNPGWEIACFKPGTDVPDPEALALLHDFNTRLEDNYGSVDIVHGQLGMGAFMRGALFSEIVFGEDGRTPIDIATPDPVSVRFSRVQDRQRGTVFQLGQLQYADGSTPAFGPFGSNFVPFDNDPLHTVRYIPIDPAPGSPYGRAMIAPALFATLFLLGLLHDVRRVIAQQGYPRIDIAIKLEQLLKEAPRDVQQNEKKYKEWAARVFDEVRSVYESLEPDDAYVHADSVTLAKTPVGTVDASSLGAIPQIIMIIERWLTRALKTMPIVMATSQGMDAQQANREWEIMAQGIKSIQHYAEIMWQRHYQLGLRAQGKLAQVEFRYAELRTAEALRDEQVRALQIDNESRLEFLGYQERNAASNALVGHPAVLDQPWILPTTMTEFGGDVNSPKTTNPEGGDSANPDRGVLDMTKWLEQRRAQIWVPNGVTPTRVNVMAMRQVPVLTVNGPAMRWRLPRYAA